MLAAGNPETLGYLPQHLLKFKGLTQSAFITAMTMGSDKIPLSVGSR
jgi:hypothetical protein